MTAPDDTPAPPAALKGSAIPKTIVAVCLALLVLLAGLLAVTRYGVLLPQARVLIEARTDGLKIGRFGRLKIEGLAGDVWHDFTIRKLTVRDEKGVWLQADDLHMTWRLIDLFRRKFHADEIDVRAVHVLRRPTLTAKTKDTGLPVSFEIDRARGRLEMLPAFSFERGVYDVDLTLDVQRRGGQRGKVRASSVLHPGDHLNVDFDVAKTRPLVVLADGVEAQGGALAGALGLSSKQPFVLKVAAGGFLSTGHFTALAASGTTEPLKASGAWTRAGGQASGRVLLTASTLTAPYARRFGPQADFSITGRKSASNLYALDVQARAENLSVRAQGLGDLGERRLGPQGATIAAASNALSRITGGPSMGPARVAGVLTGGEAAGWRFAGSANVTQLAMGGYGLAQVAGPLELTQHSGVTTLRGRLAASGGRGAGWIAAVLGGAPRASFDAARLADGRLALNKLDVVGKGLKLQATGGRGLLGGLTFKGRADLSNLAAARAGAAGSASGAWSAGQASAGKPWTFSVNAQGQKFATGYAELDRLLGARPQLKMQANLQDRRVSVASAVLFGAALKASTAGVLAPNGGLTFKLDWSATGPFRAGPVEIAGHAKGSGAITGTLGAPRADLLADLDAVDLPRLPLKNAHVTLSFLRLPDGSSGLIAVTADSAYGPARGRSAFRFPQGGVDLTELSVDAGGLKAAGALSLRRRTPSAADLTLALTRGAFLDAGRVAGTARIVDAPGGPRATLSLAGENARLPGSTVTLASARVTADGPLARLPYVVQAQGVSGAGKWSLDGRGVLAEAQPGYAATFDGRGQLGGRDVHTTETASFRFGGPERSARLRLAASDGGRISVDGRLTDAAATVQAQVAGFGLRMVDEDLDGQMDATLSLQGQNGRLDGTMEARLAGARGRGAPAASGIDGVVHGRLADTALTLDASAGNSQGLRANVNLVLPTEASASPFRVAIARQRPMQGRFSAEGEVRPLWDLLIGGERSLSGRVSTQGTLGGTLADPSATGQIAVADGRFDDGATGLSLRNVALQAGFAQNAVNVTQASGVDGHGGSVAGAGRISLLREGVSSFRLDLKGFRLIDNEQATASASGQATIARAADGKVRLSGALTIERADIAPNLPTPSGVVEMDVVEKNRPPDLAVSLLPPTRRGDGWALDVTLKAPRGVFLRGRGLDVELSLDAHVGGTTANPALSGTARVVRGDYDFAGKRFTFDTTSVVYLSTHAQDIRLDLTATRDDPTLTAGVRIRGTAAKPEITLTSTPSLPNDEVLAQVLFGRSASQLSPLEAAQLASGLSALARGGGLDIIGNLRTFAGLDRLALGGGDASGVTVSGGKYLTDNVYLELTGGGREGPMAQVEWRVRRNLSILSRLAGQSGARLAVRWRRDY
ncbi:translocation/assembly module TamB [Phenylobacterium hankyongense]|uniref:Translocation/assembly module TamB n=1 Tax=Phenylobacterium hankyongense TaxID=1813876 RepID=A0A328B1N1_9CAUL|nr:translocation/assembly module TamB domain-containing protein [Phenylobacterium hankyongense]RAK61320.1 translocation/assembly module TamB [Phenylobacterium hankyongense]